MRAPTATAAPALRPPAGPRTGRPAARTDGAGRRRRWVLLVAAAYCVQVALRLWLSWGQDFPRVQPDEGSYLALAKVLAGHPTTSVPAGVLIPGGYPLLISPVLRLADDPVTGYHLVLGLNAFVNALVLPLAHLALRRAGRPRPFALGLASAAALLSPVVFYSLYAMTDVVLPVLVLAWLLCAHGWLTEGSARRRSAYAAGLGLTAAAAMATHDRGSVTAGLTAVLIAVAALRRWAPRRSVLTAAAALAAGAAGARLLAALLRALFPDTPSSEVGGAALEGLLDPALLTRTAARLLGQIWYFGISSWGVGAVGITVCAAALATARRPRAERAVAALLLASLGAIALLSSAALEEGRLDHYVYARYLSVLMVPLFLVGATALVRAPRRCVLAHTAAAAALTVVCGAAMSLRAGGELHRGRFILWGLPDASLLAGDWTAFHLWRTTAAALALLACLALLALTRRAAALLPALCALLAALSCVVIAGRVTAPSEDEQRWNATGLTSLGGLRGDERLAMDDCAEWRLRAVQPFALYDGQVWVRDLHRRPPPARASAAVVCTPPGGPPAASWPQAPPGWSMTAVVPKHPYTYVIWRPAGRG